MLFSSGGSAGIAITGLLQKMDLCEEEMGGVSIGSLFAFLLKADYIPEEILDLTMRADLDSFFVIDPLSIFDALQGKKLGFDNGERLRTFLNELRIKKRKGEWMRDYPGLRIFACHLVSRKLVEFNSSSNVKVVDALMASMCLPPVFEPISIKGELYVDGALIDGFPIHLMQSKRGVFLKKKQEFQFEKGFLSYMFYLFNIRDEPKEFGKDVIVLECDCDPLDDPATVRKKLLDVGLNSRQISETRRDQRCESQTK